MDQLFALGNVPDGWETFEIIVCKGSFRAAAAARPSRFTLFRSDLGILDDLGPAQAILGNQLCQSFGRAALRGQTLLVESCPNAWLCQYLVENRIVAIDDVLRCAGRSKSAIPEIDVEIGDAK